MRYLHNYKTIFEGRLDDEKNRNLSKDQLEEVLQAGIAEKKAMYDLVCLKPDLGDHPYEIDFTKTVPLTISFKRRFGANWAGIIRTGENSWTSKTSEKTDPEAQGYFANLDKSQVKTIKQNATAYPVSASFEGENALEQAIRYAWAYFVSRKTTRYLDRKKTLENLVNNQTYWGKGYPLSKFKTEEAPEEIREPDSLKGKEGEIARGLNKSMTFLISLYKTLGLNIKPVEGAWGTHGFVKGMITKDEFNTQEVVDEADQVFIGCKITPLISGTSETLLGAIAPLYGDKVSVMQSTEPMLFELSKRDAFTLKGGKQVPTEMTKEKVNCYIAATNERDALKKFLTKISEAFKLFDKVYVDNQPQNIKYIFNIIKQFNTIITKNGFRYLHTLIPDINADWTIDPYDERILKILFACITKVPPSEIKKVLSSLQENCPTLYSQLLSVASEDEKALLEI
jgi:hypothetical protein